MNKITQAYCRVARGFALLLTIVVCTAASAEDASTKNQAPPDSLEKLITGEGEGWKALTLADFDFANDADDTWSEKDGVIYCTGRPVGVNRTAKTYKNFELVVEWRHMKSAGNSGVFIWAPAKVFEGLKPGRLPGGGIEIQILDHGYAENWRKNHGGKDPDWFTTNGDVFPVGGSRMKPYPPLSANGSRSFPSKNTTKGTPEWNHYYVRAVDGEVWLWVNGEKVSGGQNCQPAEGFLCLESEGSPIEFKNLRIRELE
mgnify:CR=1 FL=1